MKLVYTHENIAIASNVQSILEAAGIETELKNEFSGAGRGELGVFDTWPEVWVRSEAQYKKARQLVDSITELPEGGDWRCGTCGEENGAAFFTCWYCQSKKPES
ncbi:hypothetical protein Mag101_08470 [Microbulbifer agarilyticus]|uniref:RanBP2-type domain-containing protein n=1 Tax=Microbulbifer agarilyticus TaxID=260552 RepID=A0A1Q2M9W4_9GAMM|nr:DUF2007 domain-containing protein [Microbulbifer agarilyticus]AQQ69460.1 hypothetical protein Mag101_08470 [Microbulbifer agarilyticus]